MEYFLAPFNGLAFLKKHKSLWRYAAWPLGITVVVYLLSFQFVFGWVRDVINGFLGAGGILALILLLVVTVGLIIISFYIFVLFLNIIAGPFNEVLSEQVEKIIKPDKKHEGKFNIKNVVKSYIRTVPSEIARLGIFGLLSVTVFFGTIFSAGLLFSLISGALAIFFLVYEFVDYILARYEWGFFTKIQFIFHNLVPFGLYGLGLWVFLMIPVLNLLFIPVAVVSGTQVALQLYNKKR